MQDAIYGVWLQQAMGEGSRKVPMLIEAFGSCRAVYESDEVERMLCGLLMPNEIARMKEVPLDAAQEIMEACERLHYEVLTPDSEQYPERLRQLPDYPAALYISGHLPDIDNKVCIGMVGTRRASRYGYHIAMNIAAELAACGVVIVSGGAKGIDTASHQGALMSNGQTICVLGCGINTRYNMENEGMRNVIASTGALISEYPPGSPPVSYHFPVRNRLISALSLGVVVVEAGARSGSLITANLALDQGKDLFSVPGQVGNSQSKGSNRLIVEGAKPVENAWDVLSEYLSRFGDQINVENLTVPGMPILNKRQRRTEAKPRPQSEPETPFAEYAAAVLSRAELWRKQGGKVSAAAVPRAQCAAVPKAQSDDVPKAQSAAVPKAQSDDVPKAQSAAVPKAQSAAVPKAQSAAAPETKNQNAYPIGLSPNAIRLCEALEAVPKSFETLADCLHISASELMRCVTELELYGMIQTLPGKRYKKA